MLTQRAIVFLTIVSVTLVLLWFSKKPEEEEPCVVVVNTPSSFTPASWNLLYNPLEPTSYRAHHEIFSHFTRWEGAFVSDYVTDWLGVQTRYEWDCVDDPKSGMRYGAVQPARRIPCEIHAAQRAAGIRHIRGEMPVLDDEYEELVDVLQAVVRTPRDFVVVELGARYGTWGVRALKAWHQLRGVDARATFIGVESDPVFYQWMVDHVARNNLTHESIILHMSVRKGEDADLLAIVRKTGIDHIDYLDSDIQGSEGELFDHAPTLAYLDAHVSALHIGTHTNAIHRQLDALFRARSGWVRYFGYGLGYGRDCEKTVVNSLQTDNACLTTTPYGRVYVRDGMISYARE